MAKLEDLIKVAKELQEKFEFEPAIKTKGKSEKDLEAVIKEAAAELTAEDEISKTAKTLFKELGITIGAKAEEDEEEVEEVAEEDEEEVEEKAPAKKVPAKKAAKSAEEDDEEETEEGDEAPAKPAKKAPKEKDPNEVKLSTQEKAAFFQPLIETGKYTVGDLVKKAQEKHPGVSDSSLKTFLSDSKNEKYNKFDKLVVAAEDGKLSFKGGKVAKKA